MHFIALTAFSLISVAAASSAALARSTVNGACTGSGGAPGVCILDSSCSAAGGTYITNACPDTPDDIKCCTKKTCGNGGECMFASSCKTGTIVSGLCPGPSNFECCEPKSSTTGNLGEKILAKAEQAKGIPCKWPPRREAGKSLTLTKPFRCLWRWFLQWADRWRIRLLRACELGCLPGDRTQPVLRRIARHLRHVLRQRVQAEPIYVSPASSGASSPPNLGGQTGHGVY